LMNRMRQSRGEDPDPRTLSSSPPSFREAGGWRDSSSSSFGRRSVDYDRRDDFADYSRGVMGGYEQRPQQQQQQDRRRDRFEDTTRSFENPGGRHMDAGAPRPAFRDGPAGFSRGEFEGGDRDSSFRPFREYKGNNRNNWSSTTSRNMEAGNYHNYPQSRAQVAPMDERGDFYRKSGGDNYRQSATRDWQSGRDHRDSQNQFRDREGHGYKQRGDGERDSWKADRGGPAADDRQTTSQAKRGQPRKKKGPRAKNALATALALPPLPPSKRVKMVAKRRR